MARAKRDGAKVYAYLRVSTTQQVDAYSLEAQSSVIQRFAAYENMQVVREYMDAGVSGKNTLRPQFQEMMNDIKNKKDGVAFVLVFKLSRFGRNAADTLQSLQFMQDYGVNLISVEDNIDSSEETSKLLISIIAAVAEMERENINIQTMSGRRKKAEKGGWNGAQSPLGYSLVDGKLVVNEDEAKIVKLIFEWFTTTILGTSGVAKRLNDEGYLKPIRGNTHSSTFTRSNIVDILDNPVYVGKIRYGNRCTVKKEGTRNEYVIKNQTDPEKIIYADGQHEAIISEEVWQKAVSKRKATGFKHEKSNKEHEYVLSTLIKCPSCGNNMYGICSKSKKKPDGSFYPPYYSYTCRASKSANGKECKSPKSFSAAKLDAEVSSIILSLVRTPDFERAIKKAIGKEVDIKELQKRLSDNQKELKRLEALKQRLSRDYDSLDFDSPADIEIGDDLKIRIRNTAKSIVEQKKKIEEIQLRIENVQQQKLTQESIYKILLMFDRVYDKMTDIEKKQFMHSFIEYIEIYPERQKDGHLVKTIHFNFPVSCDGKFVTEFSPPKNSKVETVCLLTKEN